MSIVNIWVVLLGVLVTAGLAVGLIVVVVRLARRGKAAPPPNPLNPASAQSPPPSATCPRCGAPLPANSPQGLCPRCVLGVGLATQTEATDGIGPHGTKIIKPPPAPDEIGKHFPQLEILECLGRGGMGVVYKARQPKLNRIVALKILAPEKEAEPKFAERFLREAQTLARLNHPNIVTVHDFGETDGLCYLLMEFVDGLTLRQMMREGRMKPEEALVIVPRICEALQFAHEQGVVHRDIKPENVLLDKQGRVKIADFGIAKILGGTPFGVPPSDGPGEASPDRLKPELQANLTADHVLGTPHYMAPEQVEHPQMVDHRADIYSLGVVFYEMLTGELPLGRFAAPSKKVQVDVRLDEIVLRALEKEPELRYQQASVLKSEVETVAATPPPGSSRREEAPSESEPDQRRLTSPASNSDHPRALTPVAWVFIIIGVWSVLDMLLSNGIRNVSIAPGALGLPIGIGLLRRREVCRRLALWCAWAAFVSMFIMLGWLFGRAFGLFGRMDVVAKILGQPVGSGFGALLTFLLFAGQAVLLPWMYLVLIRDEVRAAFARSPKTSRPWLEWGLVVVVGLIMAGAVRLPFKNPMQTGVYFTDLKKPATVYPHQMFISVGAGGNGANLSGIAEAHARLAFYAGSPTNGWSCDFPEGTPFPGTKIPFTATLENTPRGLNCRVITSFGQTLLNIAGATNLGNVVLSQGELAFVSTGPPDNPPDGNCSVTIGWWTPKNGISIPIRVDLAKPPVDSWNETAPPNLSPGSVIESVLPINKSAVSTSSHKLEDSQRKFVRLVLDKASMTFEGQPTTWDDVAALLEKVPERKNTVLEFAVTSDQITVQQQNEWAGRCVALAIDLGFEYTSFVGIHALGSKGTTPSKLPTE